MYNVSAGALVHVCDTGCPGRPDMSLSEMADRAAASDTTRPVTTPPSSSSSNVGKAIAAVTAYFPAETLGTYLAVLAILQPQSTGGRWALYFLFLAFTWIVVMYYTWRTQQAEGAKKIDSTAATWLMVFSGVSFTIWSACTPWTPFLVFSDDAQKYAGAAAIILSPLLPMAAQVLNISPPWTQDTR
jgi:hypothetical protein